MNNRRAGVVLIVLAVMMVAAMCSAAEPVTPNASPEAKALLEFIYSISGTYTLTGQHNFPANKNQSTLGMAEYSGKTPAVFSKDMGFAAAGDKDSYLARPDVVAECIRQHRLGSIITICWHAVPPTADEPVTFMTPRGRRGGPQAQQPQTTPPMLASVQGQLTDEQFRDVLTPGTALYNKWCAQVDSVAVYLKMLQDAHVPILWRPYHEMNGDWFWWGGRRGPGGTMALYRQIFDRLVNYHHLDNLVWVWSIDRPSTPERQFIDFFPGNDFLDMVSIDIYGADFNQNYYDTLEVLAGEKPMILGEVGNPPSPAVLEAQPKWALWVIWAGMFRGTPQDQMEAIVNDPRSLSLSDPAYTEAVATYRAACGLPPLDAAQ